MGKVLATIKVFPSETTVNLQDLRKTIQGRLPTGASVYGFDEEPIAFGLVALIAHITVPEEQEGKMEEVENALHAIREISEIQVTNVSRMS